MKSGIKNGSELKASILKHCATIDMEEMARDVQPFLFNPNDVNKVRLFEKYVAGKDL
jgi:hypothetical protein